MPRTRRIFTGLGDHREVVAKGDTEQQIGIGITVRLSRRPQHKQQHEGLAALVVIRWPACDPVVRAGAEAVDRCLAAA